MRAKPRDDRRKTGPGRLSAGSPGGPHAGPWGRTTGGVRDDILVSMAEIEPTYRVPRQKRSRESLERLLDAAEEQIRAEGSDSLTVASVLNRAGLSVGAFYTRFPDKTALLHLLQDRFHKRLEPLIHAELLEEPSSPETLAEAVNRTIGILIRRLSEERELSRAFMMNSVFDQVLRERGERVNRERREVLIRVLMKHRDEIGHPDPVLAISMAYGMYAAVLRGRMVFGQEHELYYGIESDTIFSELRGALYLYLRGDAPAVCPGVAK
jgi:AcrR family transcriptional regulator